MTLVDLDPGAVAATRDALAAAELVLDGASGWVGLTACAGTAGCPRALADVRAAAALRASRAVRDRSRRALGGVRAALRRGARAHRSTVAVREAGDVELRCDGAHVGACRRCRSAAARLVAEAAT